MAKKAITKEDLKRLMSETKKKLGNKKKIESPLAKYSDSGQITCVLCKTIIRSEASWPTHISSSEHKKNIELAKRSRLEPSKVAAKVPAVTFKRPSTSVSEASQPKQIKGILKNGPPSLPEDFYDKPKKNVLPLNLKLGSKKLPQDPEVSLEKMEVDKDINLEQSTLPEGFFDDPVQDAKARNVSYKDPAEEEWERFQREIKEETLQSAEMIADDQEVATSERYIDTIDEQMCQYSKVMVMAKQNEQFKKQNIVNQEESSSGDSDVDEYLDWRNKRSHV